MFFKSAHKKLVRKMKYIKCGYAYVIGQLNLKNIRQLEVECIISPNVHEKTKSMLDSSKIEFPSSLLEFNLFSDNPAVSNLQFALEHEGVNLEVLSAAFEVLPAQLLSRQFNANPNDEYIRRLCFIWEWLKNESLPDIEKEVSAEYIEMFPSNQYATSNIINHSRFMVSENALGNRNFCPIVKLETLNNIINENFANNAIEEIKQLSSENAFNRALQYIYLSETKSSFNIENDTPNSNRIKSFIALLHDCNNKNKIDESFLVDIQNKIIGNPYSQECHFRTGQNWLEDSHGRLTVLPPAPDCLQTLMTGWLEFINSPKKIHPVIKAACGSFGLVYLHPFYDGNGRIHRFLIHEILTQENFIKNGIIIPVSTAIIKNIDQYLEVLNAFSQPVKNMWEYERGDMCSPPRITKHPGINLYRFFNANLECNYLSKMIESALKNDIKNEISYLKHFDGAMLALNHIVDLPQKDMAMLIRSTIQNNGVLSKKKRKQFPWLDDGVFNMIEKIVNKSSPEIAYVPPVSTY